eukprot:SAG11_NODE_8376_length_1023_cov_1.252165_2_plen_216_part_01
MRYDDVQGPNSKNQEIFSQGSLLEVGSKLLDAIDLIGFIVNDETRTSTTQGRLKKMGLAAVSTTTALAAKSVAAAVVENVPIPGQKEPKPTEFEFPIANPDRPPIEESTQLYLLNQIISLLDDLLEGAPNEIVQTRTLHTVQWEGYYRLLREMYDIKFLYGHVYSAESLRKLDLVAIRMFSLAEKLYTSPAVDHVFASKCLLPILHDGRMCTYFRK